MKSAKTYAKKRPHETAAAAAWAEIRCIPSISLKPIISASLINAGSLTVGKVTLLSIIQRWLCGFNQ